MQFNTLSRLVSQSSRILQILALACNSYFSDLSLVLGLGRVYSLSEEMSGISPLDSEQSNDELNSILLQSIQPANIVSKPTG